jgi:polysaccharide export outer membrane protein
MTFLGLTMKSARPLTFDWLLVGGSLLLGLMISSLGFAQAPPQTPPDSPGPAYVIGPGDVLNIFVWRNPELSVSVPVRPDGKISTPLVEDTVAVGKTTTELAKDVEAALSEYIRAPQVNVIVETAASAMSQVTVTGAVVRPGSLPYREGLRVLDAVLAVGGMSQFASGDRARIVRESNGEQTEIRVRLNRLLQRGDLSQNHQLRPGDVIVVPDSIF